MADPELSANGLWRRAEGARFHPLAPLTLYSRQASLNAPHPPGRPEERGRDPWPV